MYDHRGVRAAFWLVRALTLRTSVSGLEYLPEGGAMIVGNHRSWIDGFHVWPRVGRPLSFYAATDALYYRVPVFRDLIGHAGFIPVRRGSQRTATSGQEVIAATVAAYKAGRLVATFGEGKIGPGGDRQAPVRRGMGVLYELGVPIVPMITRGADRVAPRTGRLRWLPRLWRRVEVTFLPPLPSGLTGNEARQQLAKLFAEVV